MRRFLLGRGGWREGVIVRRGFAFGQQPLHHQIDHTAVLGVHADQCAVVGRVSHRFENRRVVHQEYAGIGREELEGRDAFLLDHRVHLGQGIVGKLGDNQVHAVVDRGFAIGFLEPGVERLPHRRAFVLDGEVHDGRRAPVRGGDGSGFEVVGRERAAEGQVHVRVHVDAAGDHILARGVDDLVGLHGQALSDGFDLFTFHVNVGDVIVGGGDHAAVLDEHGSHRYVSLLLQRYPYLQEYLEWRYASCMLLRTWLPISPFGYFCRTCTRSNFKPTLLNRSFLNSSLSRWSYLVWLLSSNSIASSGCCDLLSHNRKSTCLHWI